MKKLFSILLLCILLVPYAHAESILEKSIEYMQEVAFQSEYGKDKDKNVLHKYIDPMVLYFEGNYTDEDTMFIDAFLKTLSEKLPNLSILRSFAKEKANVVVSYVPYDQLKESVPDYIKGNWGFFRYYTHNNRITHAYIGITSDISTQEIRNHLFMEELIGSMGLANDSYTYPDSILYQEWSTTQSPNEIDWLCLQLLYQPYVKPGMSFEQMREAILKNYK